jgi:heptosyltransferase-1
MLKEFRGQRKSVREEEWDLLIDLQGNIKSGIITWMAHAKKKAGYGVRSAAERLNALATHTRFDPPKGVSVREEYLWLTQQMFQDPHHFDPTFVELSLNERQEQAFHREKKRWPSHMPIWFVAVGSNWPNKMCKTDSILQVLRMARQQFSPYYVFLAGTSDELNEVGSLAREFSSSSHVLFRQDLPLLQRLMGDSQAVLAVDSLVLHLAATTRAPTFSFFGPSSAHKYAPIGPQHGHFQMHCPSSITFDRRCPSLRTCPTGMCMKDADPEKMFHAILRWQQMLLR